MSGLHQLFEDLPWTSWQIPIPFRFAAAELERQLPTGATVDALARGYTENDECLVAVSGDDVFCVRVGAFAVAPSRWRIGEFAMATSRLGGRLLIELTAPARRTLLRLIDEDASRALVRILDELVNPRPRISFRPFTGTIAQI